MSDNDIQDSIMGLVSVVVIVAALLLLFYWFVSPGPATLIRYDSDLAYDINSNTEYGCQSWD